MGWWTQDEEGHSFATADGGEMIWGDGPADLMGEAVASITQEFQQYEGRNPTKAELRAGLEFTLGGISEEGT